MRADGRAEPPTRGLRLNYVAVVLRVNQFDPKWTVRPRLGTNHV
jgi:hypothetical protein